MTSIVFSFTVFKLFFQSLTMLKIISIKLFKFMFLILYMNYVLSIVNYISYDFHIQFNFFLCLSFVSTTDCKKSEPE